MPLLSGSFDGNFYQVRVEDFKFWNLGKYLTVGVGEVEMKILFKGAGMMRFMRKSALGKAPQFSPSRSSRTVFPKYNVSNCATRWIFLF